ncbi:unnamed protein product [Ectocarpus sp. CCAP 1310/34]|nr:unnamed protein product [Ectocarpus sp. CCAP 1310/34]
MKRRLPLVRRSRDSGIQDQELCEVLANLDIVPGQPAHMAVVNATLAWAGLEEQTEVQQALHQGAQDVLLEKVDSIFVEEANPSDDGLELFENDDGDDDTGRAHGGEGPPPYAEL